MIVNWTSASQPPGVASKVGVAPGAAGVGDAARLAFFLDDECAQIWVANVGLLCSRAAS